MRGVSDPYSFCIDRMYFNPFDVGTFTDFSLPDSCEVTAAVKDTCGNMVFDFGTRQLAAGKYQLIWLMTESEPGSKASGPICYVELHARVIGGKAEFTAKLPVLWLK